MVQKKWRRVALSAVAIGLASIVVLGGEPVESMTANSTSDGDAHPSVVALLRRSSVNPGDAFMFCSGTLLNERTVVTASHCASYAATTFATGDVLITNDPRISNDSSGRVSLASLSHVSVAASFHVNPLYKPGVGTDSYREDVSAIVVADPAALQRPGGITYPSLPSAGLLDAIRKAGTLKAMPVDVMGYGTEAAVNGAGGQTFADSNERRVANMTVSALDPQAIHEAQNTNKGSAGACYGDSGGPTFATIDGTWTILGVTSTGDIPCWATNTASRIDRDSVRAFLGGVLG